MLLLVPAAFTRVPFHTMSTAVLMVLLAIGALGPVPLAGLARQVSIGQAALYGIGGSRCANAECKASDPTAARCHASGPPCG